MPAPKAWRKKENVDKARKMVLSALGVRAKLGFNDSKRITTITQANQLLVAVNFWNQPSKTRAEILTQAMNSAATEKVLDYLATMREEAVKNIRREKP